MNRTQLIRSALAALLAVVALQAPGQNPLEIISLRHRTADQVLPALRPLVEPGATLSGQGTQLFVRASASNLAELQRALEGIDRPLRRLQISVRFDEVHDSVDQAVEAGGRISNRGTRLDVRGRSDHAVGAERIDQRVQVLEGGRAFIMLGRSSPEPLLIRESATGFEAIPRLAGDRVMLDIAPQRETLDRQQHLVTTLSARLGEWIEVGGAAQSAYRDGRGIASANRFSINESRRVWLKVEEFRQ